MVHVVIVSKDELITFSELGEIVSQSLSLSWGGSPLATSAAEYRTSFGESCVNISTVDPSMTCLHIF